MRPANDMPRYRQRTAGRGRVIIIVVAVVLFLLVTSLRQIAEVWTDFLWFDSVGSSQVWTHTWAIKIGLGVFFSAVLFVVLWLNLAIADRASPAFRPVGPEEELLSRYHDVVDRRAGTLRIVVSLVFGVIAGAGMASQWQEWLLFSNSQDFGEADPQFGIDIGFYVFKLPFLITVVDWAFASLVIVLLITAVAHYLNGGIRLQSSLERVTPQVKAHLSVLLALLALVKAADYFLQRYQILFSTRGTVDGATNTEVNAVLPALYILLFIALASFALFIVNIRRRGWVLPLVAVGIWAFVQLIVGTAYPAVYQRIFVQPEESNKEASAITHNITATRQAYGLDKVQTQTFELDPDPGRSAAAVTNNPAITRNVQLLDPKRILDTVQFRQSIESPLQFSRVSTDRYPMKMPDGTQQLTQVVISNREMNANGIPQKSWQGEKLNYTHGYGLALAAGNAVADDGAPAFSVKDIPVTTCQVRDAGCPAGIDLTVNQPNNYYFTEPTSAQQTLPDYSVVDTGSPEFDYVREGDASTQYTGDGGVPIDSLFRRAAYWSKFGNADLLISQYIDEGSRILYIRDVRERAKTVAPFLTYDQDPYPAVIDGRSVYILDAYTTTDMYPNSEYYPAFDRGDVLQAQSFNYVRNSVKVVIDTYSGKLEFYVVDESDPIARAYRSAFPDLFKDSALMSQDLIKHQRYPEDIFTVQTDLYGRYHIDDAAKFYSRDGAWEPPPPLVSDLRANNNAQPQSAAQVLQQQQSSSSQNQVPTAPIKTGRMAPYYVLNKLQRDDEPNFMLMRPYQPFSDDGSKTQLVSFIVARSDGASLGDLDTYQIPSQIDGPAFVNAQFLTDPEVSRQVTLLGQQQSSVVFGDLLLVPIEKQVVYVRTMYVVSSATPLVRYVLVYANAKTYVMPTLRQALERAFPGSQPSTLEAATRIGLPTDSITPGNGSTTTSTTTTTTTSPSSTSVPPSDAASLIRLANQRFAEADQAFAKGDTVLWAQKIKEGQELVAQAERILDGSAPASTTAPPETTAPPATDAPPPSSSP